MRALAVAREVGIPDELPRTWNWRPARDGPPHAGVQRLPGAGGGDRTMLARAWTALTTEHTESTENVTG